MNFKRALVTGGAGFIGSHLVDKLTGGGKEVFVVDNYRKGRRSNISHHFSNSKFIFDKIDVQSEKMDDVFRIFKPEVVFHLAAMSGVSFSVDNPVDSSETNIQGTVNLLEKSKEHGVKRFIFSSSSSVYGGSSILPTPESTGLNPRSPYALQKKTGEEYCKMFSDLYGLETVSLRYFNVFGPRQYGDSPYASVISSFANCKKNNLTPNIYGDGEQVRDFTYVDNVVSANILAAESKNNNILGEVFNIGSGIKISVNELHKMMSLKNPVYHPERDGDVRCSQADTSLAEEVLGYKVIESFELGLNKTIKWYMSL